MGLTVGAVVNCADAFGDSFVGFPSPAWRNGLTPSVRRLGRTLAGPCTREEPSRCDRFAGLDNCQSWLEAAGCWVRVSCACSAATGGDARAWG